MINLNEAQDMHGLIGLAIEELGEAKNDKERRILMDLKLAREIAAVVVSDIEDCEFEQQNPHEWYCKTHSTLKVAGTEEPVSCN